MMDYCTYQFSGSQNCEQRFQICLSSQGWPLFQTAALRAAVLEILSAARLSAAGVLALQHFAAAALRCSAKKTQALQGNSSLLENLIKNAID